MKEINIKKYIYILLFLTACQKSNQCIDSEVYLSAFTKGVEKELPPANPFIIFFIELKDSKIVKFNNLMLQDLYFKNFSKDLSYEEFLCSLYTNQISIEEDLFNNYKEASPIYNIEKAIVAYPIDKLKAEFCNSENNILILKSNLGDNEKMSVLYSFFRNKYFISFDDYEGHYIIRK